MASFRGGGVPAPPAREIISNMRRALAVRWQGRTFLLPGKDGFTDKNGDKGGIVINPSYIVLSAYRSFAEVDDEDAATFWKKVEEDGRWLLSEASFGDLGLPADWVMLTGSGVVPGTANDPARPPRFGLDAVRVLLYNSSERGGASFTEAASALFSFYNEMGYMPLSVELRSGIPSEEPATAGIYAIYGLLAARAGQEGLAGRLFKEAELALSSEKEEYYSFSLYLLTRMHDHL